MGSGAFHKMRVLVVEDEFVVAETARCDLEQTGATVLGPATSVGQAMRLIDQGGPIDLALLDVHLKGELVYPVARTLRASGIPFMFLTGYDAEAIDPEFATVPRMEKPLKVARAAYAYRRLVERAAAGPAAPGQMLRHDMLPGDRPVERLHAAATDLDLSVQRVALELRQTGPSFAGSASGAIAEAHPLTVPAARG
jgi:CheY-like chemotaxis protein